MGRFVEERNLGEVLVGEAGFILGRNPDTVRAPDVAFMARARIPDGRVPDGFILGAPDLAVPRQILYVDKIPLLGTGKKDYPAVKRIVEQQQAQLAEQSAQ